MSDEGGTPPERRTRVPDMDMTRERARTERRDVDKERGEPLAGGAARGGPRALRVNARPLGEWTSRPRILVTNDDGVESRGLLALKQALEGMGDVTVVAPDTNQSAVRLEDFRFGLGGAELGMQGVMRVEDHSFQFDGEAKLESVPLDRLAEFCDSVEAKAA